MASREEEKRLRREEREEARGGRGGLPEPRQAPAVPARRAAGDRRRGRRRAARHGRRGQGRRAAAKRRRPRPPARPSRSPSPPSATSTRRPRPPGCTLTSPPIEGSTHVEHQVKYKINPPTSGNHNPRRRSTASTDPATSRRPRTGVHALEHGRIDFEYRPGTPSSSSRSSRRWPASSSTASTAYKALLSRTTRTWRLRGRRGRLGPVDHLQDRPTPCSTRCATSACKYVDKGPEPGIPPTILPRQQVCKAPPGAGTTDVAPC